MSCLTKPEKRTIQISLMDRESEYREALCFGDWAVFKDKKRWNVTYKDGLMLALYPTRKGALVVAERLSLKVSDPYLESAKVKEIMLDAIVELGASACYER